MRDLMSNTIACSFSSSTANISACTDAGAALAPLLSRGNRLPSWQSTTILEPATCRLQLPQHATDGTEPKWPFPRWMRKVLLLAIIPVLLGLTMLWSDYNAKCYITARANTYSIIKFLINKHYHCYDIERSWCFLIKSDYSYTVWNIISKT